MSRRNASFAIAVAIVAVGGFSLASSWGATPHTAVIDRTPSGTPGNTGGDGATLSANGRFAAFGAEADDLVAHDLNGQPDAFVLDRKKNRVVRVSVNSKEHEATGGESASPAISADGSIVAFTSEAINLVHNDTNMLGDVFVRNRKSGKTSRISVGPHGRQGLGGDSGGSASISANGRFVAFDSEATNLVNNDGNGVQDVFVVDRKKHRLRRISVSSQGVEGDLQSGDAFISGNGRFVTYESDATTLVPNDGDGQEDIFVYDMKRHTTKLVSHGMGGADPDGPSTEPGGISSDGHLIAFESEASNLVPGDMNGMRDVFVRNMKSGKTKLASVSSSGEHGDNFSDAPGLSANGRYVAFRSDSANLVAHPTSTVGDVYVRDLKRHRTRLVSIAADGGAGDNSSDDPRLSADGRFMAFESSASNLIPTDSNGNTDEFLSGPLH